METRLGKLEKVTFGLGSYQGAMLIPVEATFEGNSLKSWRILAEVL